MLYIERVPKPPLDTYVASIWYCQSPPRQPGLERVLPSGAAQLIVNLKEDRTRMYHPGGMTTGPGALLSGVATRYGVIDTAEQECVAGVAFRPGGTVAFFAVPAHELRDRHLPLEFLWGRQRTARLRARLLQAAGPTARLDVMEEAMAERWIAPCL